MTAEEIKNKDGDITWPELFRAIFYFLGDQRGVFTRWTIILFAVFFYFLVPPYLLAKMVDFFTVYQHGDSLELFYLYSATLAISMGLVSIIRLSGKHAIGGVSIRTMYETRGKGFQRLIDYSITWHDQENTGNKVQKIQTGANSLRAMIRILSVDGLALIAQFVGVVAVFIFIDFIFLLFCIAYLLLFFGVHKYFYDQFQLAFLERNKALESSSGSYFEGATNVLTVKSLGAKDSVTEKVLSKEERAEKVELRIRDLGVLQWKVFQVVNALGCFVFLILTGYGVVAGTLTVGQIFMFFAYFESLRNSAGAFTGTFEELMEHKAAIGRMLPLFAEDLSEDDKSASFPLDWQELSITDGEFGYTLEEQEFRVRELNLIVKKQEKIGIVGHSGSGKSTLAKLLLGIYHLESGSIKLDDTSLSDIKHSELTEQISIVLQESELFNLSLKDNITLMRDVDAERFASSLRIAQLGAVIEKLPDGLDTLIGEKGYRLSGGERQRLAIARAICRDPQILVLDEATSSLDTETEEKIHMAIEQELATKTLIIIAHRISTLKDVDKIYLFEQGAIVESGGYAELMERPDSKFNQLYNQLKSRN